MSEWVSNLYFQPLYFPHVYPAHVMESNFPVWKLSLGCFVGESQDGTSLLVLPSLLTTQWLFVSLEAERALLLLSFPLLIVILQPRFPPKLVLLNLFEGKLQLSCLNSVEGDGATRTSGMVLFEMAWHGFGGEGSHQARIFLAMVAPLNCQNCASNT